MVLEQIRDLDKAYKILFKILNQVRLDQEQEQMVVVILEQVIKDLEQGQDQLKVLVSKQVKVSEVIQQVDLKSEQGHPAQNVPPDQELYQPAVLDQEQELQE